MINILKKRIFEGYIPEKLSGPRERLANYLFRKAEFDEQSLEYLREYSGKGAIVFASFQSSNIALFLFCNILRRCGFKAPTLVLDYNPILLQPLSFLWKRTVRFFNRVVFRKKAMNVLDTDYVEQTLKSGRSVLFPLLSSKFFLRRYIEVKYDSLHYFIELQKRSQMPIYFFPQMIFWNQIPERTGNIFPSQGATSNRGFFSALISTSTPSYVRILQPINLQEVIAESEGLSTNEIALRLRNRLIEMHQKEKRIVLGPVLRSQQEMIEKVLFHKDVLQAISKIAAEEGVSEEKLKRKAYKYYREIAADYSFYYIRFFEKIIDYIFRKIFSGITWDPEGLKMIREAAQKGPIVLTPCHKSHMDYLILSYIFMKNMINPPHVAAGANLSFFPVGTLFRHSGAFFLRRSFKGLTLYPVVFRQYLKTLVQESYPIEFFIEGGRTRTGRLVYPKLGILHYLIDAVDSEYTKDLVFIPISVGYDRVLEEDSYAQELKGKNKAKETMGTVVKSSKVLWRKHGMVYVNFDKPFTLKEIEAQGITGNDRVTETANRIIKGINRVTAIGPFSLATTAMLLMSAKGFSRKSLIERMKLLHDHFTSIGVKIYEKTDEPENYDTILDYVFASYKEDKIIEELKFEDGKNLDGMHTIREENRARIAFYKNSISHFLIGISFTCLGILALKKKGEGVSISGIGEHFLFLKKLCQREFIYPDEIADHMETIRTCAQYLEKRGILSVRDDTITLKDDTNDDIAFFARATVDILESYLAVIDVVERMNKKKIPSKDLFLDIRKNAIKMYHLGFIKLPESLSTPTYKSALLMLKDDDIIVEENSGKKNAVYSVKDKVAPRKLKERIEQFLTAL
jgi:glycerol-3-phosphate O-acyltransferase